MNLGGMLGGMLGGAGGIGGLMGMMGGPLGSILGPILNKVLSQVFQGVIEDVAKQLKLPDSVKDMAQAQVAGAFGDTDGVKKNVKELLSDLQKETGASDADMGDVSRKTDDVEKAVKEAMTEWMKNNAKANNEEADRSNGDKKKNGNKSSGSGASGGAAGGEAAGGAAAGAGAGGGAEGAEAAKNAANPGNDGKEVDGASDWFTKIAYALAKGAQQQADKVASKSDALTAAMDKAAGNPDDKKAANEQMKLQTELQAESSKLGFLMTALNATINALGEAMKTAAQVK
jgi:hypothetical protein